MNDKVRFASDAWVAAAQEIARDLLKEANGSLDGYTLRCCEVFANAPADLPGRRPDGARAWNWEMRNGQVTMYDGEIDDVDFKVFTDYEGILPLAKSTGAEVGEAAKQIDAHREEMLTSGRLRMIGDRSSFPEPVNAMLHEFHNRLAARTL